MTTTEHGVERYADIDLYGALHLTGEASADLVEKASWLCLLEVHPDLAGAARTDQAALVNAAGEILRQPAARPATPCCARRIAHVLTIGHGLGMIEDLRDSSMPASDRATSIASLLWRAA